MTAYEEPRYYDSRTVYAANGDLWDVESYIPRHRAWPTRTGGSTANTLSPNNQYWANTRVRDYEREWTNLDRHEPRHRV